MKRPLILLAAILVAVFLLITALPWRSEEQDRGPAEMDRGRQRVRDFWTEFNRAGSFRTAGRFREAAETYRKSLDFNPRHEDSLYYLATSLHELGEYEAAVATLRKLIEINPESARAHSQLGNTLSTLAPGAPLDLQAAREAYHRNIEVNKEQAGPFLRLGTLDLNEGKFNDALEHFRIAAASGAPEAAYLKGYTHFLQGKFSKGKPFLLRILDAYEQDKNITAKGVLSEGDVLPGPDKRLTALEKAGLMSSALLGWIMAEEGSKTIAIPRVLQVKNLDPSGQDEWEWSRVSFGSRSGGRAVWGDADNDHRPDLVVAGNQQPLTFYHNRGGELVDATAAAGLSNLRSAFDAAWIDFDSDGLLDLYLIGGNYVAGGRNRLYRNQSGKFSDVTLGSGLEGVRQTFRAFPVDCDGDGQPELVEVGASGQDSSAVRLFRNRAGKFSEATRESGLQAPPTAVDIAEGDFDRDGHPDLAILYWKGGVKIYRGTGPCEFSDATAAFNISNTHEPSFSLVPIDFDNDGWLDLLVTAQAPAEDAIRCLIQPELHFARFTPRLYRNSKGSFQDVTAQVGLNRSYGTMQAVAADFDADGWVDLLLVNGSLEALRLEPSVVLRNDDGKRFREWFRLPPSGRATNAMGAAVADFNGDGRPDIYLATHPLFRRESIRGGLFTSRKGKLPEKILAGGN